MLEGTPDLPFRLKTTTFSRVNGDVALRVAGAAPDGEAGAKAAPRSAESAHTASVTARALIDLMTTSGWSYAT